MPILDLDKEFGSNEENEKPAAKPSLGDPGWFEPGSQSEAAVRGFANGATFGLAPKISAGVNTALGKIAPDTFGDQPYAQRLKDYLQANRQAEDANPKTALTANLLASLPSTLATGGGGLLRQAGVNFASGAANAYGNTTKEGTDALGDMATAGAINTTLGAVLPTMGKVANTVATNVAKNNIVQNLTPLITDRSKAATQKLEKLFGTTNKQMVGEGSSLRGGAQDLKDSMLQTGKDSMLLSDVPDFAQEMITKSKPSITQLGKDMMGTAAHGVKGAALASGINYVTGSNVDPMTAALAGVGLGGYKAGGKFFNNLGDYTAKSLAMSPRVMSAIEMKDPIANATNRILAGDATSGLIADTGKETSPFSRLTDYLNNAKDTQNPVVQQKAQEAASMQDDTDADSKRRAAMQLQGTPEGRAVTNKESGIRDLDSEF